MCSNSGDHLSGNVLVQYTTESAADSAVNALNGRFYGGRALVCELTHVDDFREAICRSFENETCARGGFCNFLHPFHISEALEHRLLGDGPRRVKKQHSEKQPVQQQPAQTRLNTSQGLNTSQSSEPNSARTTPKPSPARTEGCRRLLLTNLAEARFESLRQALGTFGPIHQLQLIHDQNGKFLYAFRLTCQGYGLLRVR